MVREIKNQNLLSSLRRGIFGPLFFPMLLIAAAVLTIPVYNYLNTLDFDLRQQAFSKPTAVLRMSPEMGSFKPDQLFSVNIIIDGGGQSFNAAQADIDVSPNLRLQNLQIVPVESGGCNFTFVNKDKTPTMENLSFAGAILGGGSVDRCTLFTLTFKGIDTGNAIISYKNEGVKSRSGFGEIFFQSHDGEFMITNDNGSAATSFSGSSNSSDNPQVSSQPVRDDGRSFIAIDPYPKVTFENSVLLTGAKTSDIAIITVNGTANGAVYPSSNSWQYLVQLKEGANQFNLAGLDQSGHEIDTKEVVIINRQTADISGDNVVDMVDLSMFATDWENTGALQYELSDANSDGLVDLSDFSILAAYYEL